VKGPLIEFVNISGFGMIVAGVRQSVLRPSARDPVFSRLTDIFSRYAKENPHKEGF
jgi:hypothetical protein